MNNIFLEKPNEAAFDWLQHSAALKYEGQSKFKRVCVGKSAWTGNIPKTDSGKRLTEVQLAQKVQSIGSTVFSSCTALSAVTFPSSAQLSSIGNYAFYKCTALKSISLPSSLVSIGQNSFSEAGIISIDFGGTKTIGNFAFQSCFSLGSADLENVREVGEYAFARLNLKSARFGESLRSLKKYAFYSCSGLADVWFDGDMPACAEQVFANAKTGCIVHIRQDRDWSGLQPGDTWQGMTIQFQDS